MEIKVEQRRRRGLGWWPWLLLLIPLLWIAFRGRTRVSSDAGDVTPAVVPATPPRTGSTVVRQDSGAYHATGIPGPGAATAPADSTTGTGVAGAPRTPNPPRTPR